MKITPHAVTLDVYWHTDLTSPDGVDVHIATITIESAAVPNAYAAGAFERTIVEDSVWSVVEGMAEHALVDDPRLSLRVRRREDRGRED